MKPRQHCWPRRKKHPRKQQHEKKDDGFRMVPPRFSQRLYIVVVFILLVLVLIIAVIESTSTIDLSLILAGVGGALLAVIFSNRLCAVTAGKTLMIVRKGRHHWAITMRLFAFLRVVRQHNSAPLILRQMVKDFTMADQMKFPPGTLLEAETWLINGHAQKRLEQQGWQVAPKKITVDLLGTFFAVRLLSLFSCTNVWIEFKDERRKNYHLSKTI